VRRYSSSRPFTRKSNNIIAPRRQRIDHIGDLLQRLRNLIPIAALIVACEQRAADAVMAKQGADDMRRLPKVACQRRACSPQRVRRHFEPELLFDPRRPSRPVGVLRSPPASEDQCVRFALFDLLQQLHRLPCQRRDMILGHPPRIRPGILPSPSGDGPLTTIQIDLAPRRAAVLQE
jgi:hypothetical protein